MPKKVQRYESQFVAVDVDGYPIFATVSLDEQTAKTRLMKIAPSQNWDYYKTRYTIKKVTIAITEEK